MPIQLAHADPTRLDWHRHARTAATSWPSAVPAARPAPGSAPSDEAYDAAFVALQAAYRGHGGIAQGDALGARLARVGRGGYVDLVRHLVAGELFSFQWHGSFWVPLFQFDPALLTPRLAPRCVLDELHGVLAGWDIANWYVRGQPGLDGRCPLDVLDSDLAAVLDAARAERHAAEV